MPIRRRTAVPIKEAPPANPPEDAKAESSAPAKEDKNKDPAPAEPAKDKEDAGDGDKESTPAPDGEEQLKTDGETAEGEKPEQAPAEQKKSKKKKVKEVVETVEKDGDDKVKKVKKKIPSWATISGNKIATTNLSHPKAEEIIIEAIESCKEQRGGASAVTIIKYVLKKYPTLEMDNKTKNLYKKALKRMVEKGTVKQLKGKGFSGSFAIGKKPAVTAGPKETLGESLPLIMTRLCEPKEASYILIKKYLEQHFPQLNVENRPEVLKNCLQRSVEKGYLEQITGKGASGTFQLKKAGNKVLMSGGLLEDAVVTAITAMNEPKTCSIAILRKFLIEKQMQKNGYFIVSNLKRTLQKCKVMGWMEQISGHGLSGTYQLCYPYYPSPAVLFPEMIEKLKKKEEEKLKRKRKSEDSEEEEEEDQSEEESEEESDEEEPPQKRRAQRAKPVSRSKAHQNRSNSRKPAAAKRPVAAAKRPVAAAKRPVAAAKRPVPAAKRPVPAAKRPVAAAKRPVAAVKRPVAATKRPVAAAKKSAQPAKKPASKAAPKKAPEPAKATPVKKAAPTRKPKTPAVKKMTSRGSKRPAPKAAKEEIKPAVKTKPAARKSLRAKK